MGLTYTPLDPDSLSPNAQRALSSPPAKMMAARGMAPIADPADLVTVFYQLAQDDDDKVKGAAVKSIKTLPDAMLLAGLKNPSLDERVLDFFGKESQGRTEILEAIVLNRATADETVADIAGVANAKITDLIAGIDDRLLRYPEIVGKLYNNTNARMSSVDRAVELAIRNDVTVPGIAAWNELRDALLEGRKDEGGGDVVEVVDPGQDEAIANALGRDDEEEDAADGAPETPVQEEKKEINPNDWKDLGIAVKIRMATIGGGFWRSKAISDPKPIVAMAALKSPMVKDKEVLKWAGNAGLDKRLIAFIVNKKEWVQQYSFKVALVQNPKTAIKDAMRLVPHLREKDLKIIMRSKGVPTAVVSCARRVVQQRAGGKKG